MSVELRGIVKRFETTRAVDGVDLSIATGEFVALVGEVVLRLLAPRGWIAGDNTFLFGALFGETDARHVTEPMKRSMQSFNTRLADASQFEGIMLPTPEGMTVARRKT